MQLKGVGQGSATTDMVQEDYFADKGGKESQELLQMPLQKQEGSHKILSALATTTSGEEVGREACVPFSPY